MPKHLIECPICHHQTFEYISFSEECYGTVEQHGYCDKCGYTVEQAYSPVYEAFYDIKKGYKDALGRYHPKNAKRHKRIRRRLDTKNIDVNPSWVFYI